MTLRLVHGVIQNWETLDGYAVAHGMPDLRELPLGRLANFAYWRFTEGREEKDLHRFITMLWKPPKGVTEIDARSPWSAENETAGFNALAQSLGAAKSGTTKVSGS